MFHVPCSMSWVSQFLVFLWTPPPPPPSPRAHLLDFTCLKRWKNKVFAIRTAPTDNVTIYMQWVGNNIERVGGAPPCVVLGVELYGQKPWGTRAVCWKTQYFLAVHIYDALAACTHGSCHPRHTVTHSSIVEQKCFVQQALHVLILPMYTWYTVKVALLW